MARPSRSGRMEAPTRTLVIVGCCGSVLAAAVGAAAGSDLRVPHRYITPSERVITPTEEVFLASAPAYPTWAPEPLYPRAERDPLADFAAAWDDAMTDAPRIEPVAFNPPTDLPPPYVVRMHDEPPPPVVLPAAPPVQPRPPERGGKAMD